MENEDDSTKENSLKRRIVDQKNATETEPSFLTGSKMSTIKATSEEEEKFATGEVNSFREETAGENNGTLKGTSVSGFYSNGSSAVEKREDESIRGNKANAVIVKVTSAERADEAREYASRNESPSDGTKREMQSSEKTGDTTTAGRRRRLRPFRDIIGKREERREELEKMEGDLRQRLDMLECSVPAVMVWNIWRMAQGAPVCGIRRILEKQFKEAAASVPYCRSTPSRHYDCRVREVEAERKLALKKVEEARALWTEKLASLEERGKRLEEARRIQQERKDTVERLSEEAKALREAMEKAEAEEEHESCRYGECGDTRCKRRWLERVSSVTSIESGDIQCLEKLQRLAEEEMVVKRDIAELERREDAYMRTLQQADEFWSKMEVDAVSATSALREQLDAKIAANQQLANRVCELEDALERCRMRMAACRAELEKFLSVEKLEATIGREDDVAEVADKEVAVRAKVVHRPIGRLDDIATVKDDEALARVEVVDERTLARIEVADEETLARTVLIDADTVAKFVGDDKYVSVKPDTTDLAVDRQVDLVRIEDAESAVLPEDIAYEQRKLEEVKEYLAKLGSLEELYKEGEACAPDFVCNNEVFSPTGMTDEEMIALGIEPAELAKKVDEKLVVSEEKRERRFREELTKEPSDVTDYIERKERKTDEAPDVETERKVAEKTEERIAEDAMDTPVREVITRQAIQEEAADDGAVTMPDYVRTPEVKTVEADQNDVIQPNKIVSKIDTTTEIKPQEVVEEKDLTIAENKQREVMRKDEVKIDIEAESKLNKEGLQFLSEEPTELFKIDPVTKIQVESAILPEITTEATNLIAEEAEKKLDTNEQEIIIENKLGNKLIVPDKKEIEPKIIETLTVQKVEHKEEKIIPERAERIEMKIEEISTEAVAEREAVLVKKAEANEILDTPVKINESKVEEDKIKMVDKEEKIPYAKVINAKEIAETPPVAEMKEIEEQVGTEEAAPTMEEAEKLMTVSEVSPIVNSVEVEKFEPSELPTADAAEVPTAMEEKIEVEKPSLPLDIEEEKIEVRVPSIPPAVIGEKIEIDEPAPYEDIEVTKIQPIADIVTEDEMEIVAEDKMEKPSPITDVDIVEEKVEEMIQPITEPPTIQEEVEEVEAIEQPTFEVEIIKEKEVEIEEKPVAEVTEPPPEELPPIEKEEIPMKVALPAEPIPPVEDKEKEVPLVEKKPRVEEKVSIAETKPPEAAEMPTIDQRLAAQPYFIITKVEERELLHIIHAIKPSCTACRPVTCCIQSPPPPPPVETAAESLRITRTTDVLQQTEVVQITARAISTTEPRTQPVRAIGEYLKPSELKASAEIAGDRPEITGRKMLWRKRLKDQSTVTTSSTGSQTDKTSHVSHDRVEREPMRVPTDELLRSIKIAAGLTRGDTEREIRTINYGRRSDEMACNCCLCGRTAATPPSLVRPRVQVQPQIDVKTVAPAAAAFKRILIPPKIDRPIPYDKLCPDCKTKIQGKMPREKHHVEKVIKKISREQESYVCATSNGDKLYRAVPRTRAIEKRDQSCLAKIHKRKTDTVEEQRKIDSQITSKDTIKSNIEPLVSSCICFKLEKTGVEPMRKGNCYCAD